MMRFKEYRYFQSDKRILLVGEEDIDDLTEFFLSVSPWKIRVATRNQEDYESCLLFGDKSVEEFKGDRRYAVVYEAFLRHKRFWEFLVRYFTSYKKIKVEWVNSVGKVTAVRYEFFRHHVGGERYGELVKKILDGVNKDLWSRYQKMLKDEYVGVDAQVWELEFERWLKDYRRV